VGEQLEEVKSYLGVGRIGVGDGRRGGVVEEGGRRWWTTVASQRRRADSAGIGLGRARDGAVEVRGEVEWLGEGSSSKNGGETATEWPAR